MYGACEGILKPIMYIFMVLYYGDAEDSAICSYKKCSKLKPIQLICMASQYPILKIIQLRRKSNVKGHVDSMIRNDHDLKINVVNHDCVLLTDTNPGVGVIATFHCRCNITYTYLVVIYL